MEWNSVYSPIKSNINTVDEMESELTRVFQNSTSELVGEGWKAIWISSFDRTEVYKCDSIKNQTKQS